MLSETSDIVNLSQEQLNDKYNDLKKKKNKYKLQVIELQNKNKILSQNNFIPERKNNYMASIIQPYLNKLLPSKDDESD